MLGSATTADECVLLKNTTGAGGVGISLPEMQKEANLGGIKEGSQDVCACRSEVGWGQPMLPLATCRSTPLAKQMPDQKSVPASFTSI